MLLLPFCLLVSATAPDVVNGNANEKCVSFKTNTTVVPVQESYAATLHFSVHNACEGEGRTMNYIKVAKATGTSFLDVICHIIFRDDSPASTSGCTYDARLKTFAVVRHINDNEHETLTLEGELENGVYFSKAVEIRPRLFPPEKPRQVSIVLVVSVTVGVIVAITVITLITVCCLRSKNNRGATQDTSQQPPVPGGDTYYLHPINPDAVPKPVPTENRHACRKQSHTRSDEDDDGYTFPDLPRSAGRKRDVPKPVYRNTRVSGDTAKPKGRTSKPSDDGYILPDPVHPDKIKRGDDQSFLENINTDATNKRSVARRAPRSHKYGDDGYVAPNPAVSNQRGQVPKTSLYQNTNPVTGQAKANSKKFDDDGYVMSDRLKRCEGKVDTYF